MTNPRFLNAPAVDEVKAMDAEAALRTLLPGWKHAQKAADMLEQLVLAEARKLASARGVGFIRLEQLEAEFEGTAHG